MLRAVGFLPALAVALLVSSVAPAGHSRMAARSASADDVDDYIDAQMRRLHIPGLSLAVVRDGRLVKAQGYGLANLELKVPVRPQTAFEIGSVGKQFTSAAVLLLVEEGTLSLDASVHEFFPQAPPSWRGITIRHLLQHTSGIQNHVAVPGYIRVFKTNLLFEAFPPREELLDLFFKLPLEFRPGETWAYDNTGYYLLGLIIEQASGRSYWDFLDERIFRPLGMAATRNTDTRPIVANRAAGYEWIKDRYENRPVLAPHVAFSAGSLLSTVEDFVKWDAALNGDALLRRSSREALWRPARTNDGAPPSFDYGLGWFIDTYQRRRIVMHSGGTPGFSSTFYRFLDDHLTVIILTNHSDRILDQLALDIAGMYAPALRRPEGNDPDPSRTERHKAVIAGLLEGKHEDAAFTNAMATFLRTATGKGFWQWTAAHGTLDSLVFSGIDEVGGLRVVRYRAVLGGSPYWISVRLVAGGRIAQITWW